MRDLDELTAITADAIQLAHDILSSATPTSIRTKMDRDFVTDVDLQIERELRDHLAHITPEAGFLGEEEDHTGPTDTYWTLDPIDGTTNFIHGLPFYAVSLALVGPTGTLVGTIDAPALDLRYHATAGRGAYRNGTPINASTTTDLSRAVVAVGDYATGPHADEKNTRRLRLTAELASRVERIRMIGSAALDLAFVADGRLDGSITLSNKPWDTAAGALIASEAGASITGENGARHNSTSIQIIACCSGLSMKLDPLVNFPEQR